MAKKPGQPKRKAVKTPAGAEPGPVATQNVILERMEEQQRAVIVAVTMMREELGRRLDDVGRKLSSKIDVLRGADEQHGHPEEQHRHPEAHRPG